MMTPQRPVGFSEETRYSDRTPASWLQERSVEAYLSEPTQPMKIEDLGGSMYCEQNRLTLASSPVFGDKQGEGLQRVPGTYLCAASSILGCTAGYELSVVVLEQVFVETHMTFFGEDGIVRLKTVILKHCFISATTHQYIVARCSKDCGLPLALNIFKQ